MKPTIIVLLLLACAASGQWFEGYIGLPDSLHSGGRPVALLYNPVDKRTYVGGDESDRLVVFDSSATSIVGSVRAGLGVRALCIDSATNTIYCACHGIDSVAIIDGNTGALIRRLWSGGDRPYALCYNPRYNKVYCGNFDGWVQVIDAESRQRLGRVRAPTWPQIMDCDPSTGEVFIGCTYADTVAILDGAVDSIVARIPLMHGSDVTGVVVNPLDGLVYASTDGGRVYLIDPNLRRVVDSVVVGGAPCGLCLNSVRNRLYVACGPGDESFIAVIDCATRLVLTNKPLASFPLAICYNSVSDKVYCSCWDDVVVVFDGATNRELAWPNVGDYPINLCYSPAANRVLCANNYGRSVTTIDGAGNWVVATTSVCGTAQPGRMCWDSYDRRIYVASAETSGVVWVIDGVTDVVLDSIRVGNSPSDICYGAQRNKVYCANRGSGTVSVIDCNTNEVVATVHTGSEPIELSYHGQYDKVYCANRGSSTLSVISGFSDSVVANISVGTAPSALCYNPLSDRLYCANYAYSGSVSVVDCVGDTVVKTIGTRWPGTMVCDTVLNFIYGKRGNGYGLQLIDCALDSVVAVLGVQASSSQCQFDALTIMDYQEHLLLVGSHRDPPPPQRGLIYGYTIVNTQARSVVRVEDLALDIFDHPVRVFRSARGNAYCAMDNGLWCLTSGTQFDLGVATNGFALNPYWNQVLLPAAQFSRIAVIGESRTPAVEEYVRPQPEPARPSSTLNRGLLFLPAELGVTRQASSVLLDISGRKVAELHPGANDVRALAPGVYFFREGRGQVRKVVITR